MATQLLDLDNVLRRLKCSKLKNLPCCWFLYTKKQGFTAKRIYCPRLIPANMAKYQKSSWLGANLSSTCSPCTVCSQPFSFFLNLLKLFFHIQVLQWISVISSEEIRFNQKIISKFGRTNTWTMKRK